MRFTNGSALLLLLAALSATEGFVKKPPVIGPLPTAFSSLNEPSSVSLNLGSSLFQSMDNTPLDANNRHSASDWLYNIRTMPSSEVLKEVKNPVLAVFWWSLAVSVVQRSLQGSGVGVLQRLAQAMSIPVVPHSFLVSALGLLLVFRTNSAYQRFYEGRKIWENILSISRNLSRMIQLYSKDVGSERKQRIMNLVAAYPYLLRNHIRPGCLCEKQEKDIPKAVRLQLYEPSMSPVDTRYEGDKLFGGKTTSSDTKTTRVRECCVDRRKLPWSLFSKPLVEKIARVQNRPLWVCDRIGREIVSIPYTPNFTSRERLSMLSKVDRLTDAIGQCERIHQTAVPLNYARHALRSLTLWLFTLPFALVQDLGLFTAPVSAAIAWLMFGIYHIGYLIENPFQGSLRLSILCHAIRRDVLGVMGGSGHIRDSAYSLSDMREEDALADLEVPEAPDLLSHLPRNSSFLESSMLVNGASAWNAAAAKLEA